MRILLIFLFILSLAITAAAQHESNLVKADKPLFRDPVFDGAADPALIYHKKEKKWYMFYTNRRATDSTAKGVTWVHGTRIGMAVSNEGAHWTYIDTANIGYRPDSGYTFWAPALIEHNDLYHMYLTYVPGIFDNWKHPRYIVHLTSADLHNWKYESVVPLANDKVIDAYVVKIAEGKWRMYYNNEKDHKAIYYADSRDLYRWEDKGRAIHDSITGEGPIAFSWQGRNWLIVDNWKGLGVYSSIDWAKWSRQEERLLEKPGSGAGDQFKGSHADVVIHGDRAYLFYFVQPEKRSAIQVVELRYHADGTISCDRNQPTYINLQ